MAKTVILEEQVFTGFADIGGIFAGQITVVPLNEGESYRVSWDGETFDCIARTGMLNGNTGVGLGNFSLANIGEATQEPFLLGVFADGSMAAVYTTENEESHRIGIYQVEQEEIEPEQPEGIVLKDRNGNDVAYYGIETVTFDTTTEGKQQTFTKGTKAEKTVALEMADGDLVVESDPGTLLGKVIVTKPETHIPENIRNGISLGGLVGSFIGDTEELTVDLNMADGDQVIVPTAEGKVISKVQIQKPETLIPENIAEGIDIAGIIGTLAAGGGAKFAIGQSVSMTSGEKTFAHNLGVIPDIIILLPKDAVAGSSIGSRTLIRYGISSNFANSYTYIPKGAAGYYSSSKWYVSTYNTPMEEATSSGNTIYNVTETNFTTGANMISCVWLAIGGLT